MKRTFAVAALAISTAACSSTNTWWNHSSGRDSNGGHATAMNEDTNNARPTNGGSASANQGGMSRDISEQDRTFVRQASEGGLYEVQSSQLALQKTQDAHVRMIAQHMIHDHTQANQQLMEAARQDGLTAESQPSQEQQQMIKELRGLNGSDFDQRYLQQQAQAHQQTIALFQQEANGGQGASLRTLAAQTLPALQEHLRMIQGNNSNISNERP